MAKRLFSCTTTTNSDEIEYFAELLAQNNIQTYVVPGSAFGLSKPSLWVTNDEDFSRAKALFNDHESLYAQMAREKYQQQTGYDPEADLKEKFHFLLRHLYEKRGILPWLILGFLFLAWYFREFFRLFLPAQ